MNNRVMNTLLALIITIGLIPFSGSAGNVHAASAYDLWVGGVQVTSENQNDVFHDGTVRYSGDATAGTLTLNNAKITGTSTVIFGVDFNIEVKKMNLEFDIRGNNELSGAKGGIGALEGSIGFSGGGSLTITSETYPVRINAAPITLDNVTMKATGNTETFSTCNWGNGLTVNNADLTVTTRTFPMMIYGDFVMNGGSVTSNAVVSGITCQEKSIINAGTIHAAGNTGFGFFSRKGMVINSGVEKITAKGGNGKAIATVDGDKAPEGTIELNGVIIDKPEGGKLNTEKTIVCQSDGVTTAEEAVLIPGEDTGTIQFEDVHEGDYFYDAVLWAVKHDPLITNGTSETTFSPGATCTRAQVVTFLWRAAGEPEPSASANPFTDVPSDAYYAKAVLWAVGKNITNGTSETTFGPDDPCTRCQVVTFLWRAADKPAPAGTDNPFKDVESGSYYYNAVLWAVNHTPQITNGMEADVFGTNKPCTRGQIVTFLYRALGAS